MKVGHEIPVNVSAARVMARGEHFEFKPLETEVCSAMPLAIRECPADCEDLAGQKFGRLRVLGLSQDVNRRWVCRCACGNYVLRRSKAIKQAAADSCCPQCYLLAVARREEFKRRTGKERFTHEFMQ